MGILSWIVFGLIAGAIAKLLHKGDDPGGWIVTILIGIAGAVVGGFLTKTLLGWESSGWTLKALISAVGGAFILLVLYRLITTKRS
ncbi:MAG: GlsB/YeaQ/YmgE family stress response membrane protein [Niastella sp.]|nr:GlsB/YeaQ/YmgE family stress response membrane protein [Niastella sp.]